MKVDKRRKVTPETVKRLRELRSNGMTYQAISKKIGLSYLTVYKYLNADKTIKDKTEVKKKEHVDGKLGFFGSLKKKLGM
jgi:DNA invertase Pin-like site-specific DNA recombinase